MSVQTKKRFKNLGKIVGIGLFTLLMLTNIKLALLDDNEITSGGISLLGVEMQLFEPTYACGMDCAIAYSCISDGSYVCAYIVEDGGGNFCFYINDTPY